MRTHTSLLLLMAGLSVACTYQEDALSHVDLTGTVRIPKHATQLTLVDDDFNERQIDDPRSIGPVYLGVFSGVEQSNYGYTHPEIGPVVNDEINGNTYPYGGTTVGRFAWGCYRELRCKLVSGRFVDYADVLTYFSDVLDDPILNEELSAVGPEEYKERCYEVLDVTSDAELDFITAGKESPDNKPDFEDKGDYYEAEVTIPHTLFSKGVAVWGWVDMPSTKYKFATCEEEDGDYIYYYDEEYYLGTNTSFALNYPDDWIDDGDWLSENAAIIDDPDKAFEIELGYKYEE